MTLCQRAKPILPAWESVLVYRWTCRALTAVRCSERRAIIAAPVRMNHLRLHSSSGLFADVLDTFVLLANNIKRSILATCNQPGNMGIDTCVEESH
jgi:hypothetical protein